MSNSRPCFKFQKWGECPYRDRCKYSHNREDHGKTKSQRSQPQPTSSDSESLHRSWVGKVLRGSQGRPLGDGLAAFFQEAERLASADPGLMQDIISKLASEGGLRRIKELAEQDFHMIVNKAQIFELQLFPFFKTIAKSEVLDSLLLEQQVATIYNFLFGVGGARSSPLFEFVAETLDSPAIRQSEGFISALEYSVAVFSKLVDLNTLASVQQRLVDSAQQIEKTFIEARQTHDQSLLANSESHLRRLFGRLKLGLSFPTGPSTTERKQGRPSTAFPIQREPPGGRHDNDFEDIGRIKILPTIAEMYSQRSEYLPENDPSRWHIQGVVGLLDRNFRLLREDTVGQLRDAVYQYLQDSVSGREQQKSRQREGLRTHVYADATIGHLSLDRSAGFHFQVRFPQPARTRGLSAKDRAEWWERSKHLKPDALVCIVEKKNIALFCTVTHPPRQAAGRREGPPTQCHASLSENAEIASTYLTLVDQDDANAEFVLNRLSSRSSGGPLTIVEFPGVLLPAFYHTLKALQGISHSGDMPFAEYLAPTQITGYVNVPAPAYTRAPGFSLGLSAVMNQGKMSLVPEKAFDLNALQENSSLDKAQASSLIEALSHRLSLIQGPPGTGKSYTGVAVLKVLLDNKKSSRLKIGPILCICYTNHALDQLLEDVLDSGATDKIIRVGSQSKSEKLEKHNLRYVARTVGKTRMENREYAITCEEMEKLEREFLELLNKSHQAESPTGVRNFLKESGTWVYQQLFGIDGDGFQMAGADRPDAILKAWLHGKPAAVGAPEAGGRSIALHGIPKTERKKLYYSWIAKHKSDLNTKLKTVIHDFKAAQERQARTRDEQDLRCLCQADIIGITTSGLARKIDVLRRVHSKVTLCEEAGEVLEPHLLAALVPSVEHAILIGDHLQLRPQVQNFALSRENHRSGAAHSLDVSLFERLVQPNVDNAVQLPYSTLEVQRRMHPSISRLIRETLYPALQDHPSVLDHPDVAGMKRRLFWLDHDEYESNATDDAAATSHVNVFEINMVAALVTHLTQQGTYKAGDIAVLTPYLGQLHRLRSRLSNSFAIALDERDECALEQAGLIKEQSSSSAIPAVYKSSLLRTLRAATIDNFQGEEAKVVIISLVRSNPQQKCGFLKTSNRINVLLSRAQHGMYIIGNSKTSAHVDMWANVMDILSVDGNLGTKLQLQCSRHPEKELWVSKPDDFTIMSPEGGCNERCVQRLQCGHACLKKCHSQLMHGAVHCLEPCQRSLGGCDHPCPKSCGDPCPAKCTVIIKNPDRVLPCGHFKLSLPCWKDKKMSLVKCQIKVTRKVPGCDHEVEVECHENIEDPTYRCPAECKRLLPCGHLCRRRCSDCRTYDENREARVDHGECIQRCGRDYSTCAHTCQDNCHGKQPCNPCNAPCSIRCGHSQCQKRCNEPCTPCAEETCLSSCPHSACSLPCAAPCDHVPCSKRCESLLSCGHRCPSVCGEVCPSLEFCQICANGNIKEKEVDLLEGKQYAEINLDENPCIFPQCGHSLTIESMDGLMGIAEHYETTEAQGLEIPVALKYSASPFSMDDIKKCPTCRSSLRNLARYGRLIRRALLDESTKKLILWTNQTYVPLSNELRKQLLAIKSMEEKDTPKNYASLGTKETGLPESRNSQIGRVGKVLNAYDAKVWKQLEKFRNRILVFRRQVQTSEQPFGRVRDAVRAVRQRTGRSAEFSFDESVLQTKGFLLVTSLLLRFDLALLMSFLALKKPKIATINPEEPTIILDAWKFDCKELLDSAVNSERVPQQVEALIYLTQISAIQRSQIFGTDTDMAERFRRDGQSFMADARQLCAKHPGQTRGLPAELDQVEVMLREYTFYSVVSTEEREAVIRAMATEMRGTGHWYYCANGHPFTIGECGMPMEQATCPECSAPVGGQNHESVQGNRHAEDLEQGLRRLRL